MFGIIPYVPGITSLSFFKRFDLVFPFFTILSDFQLTYPRSRCHGIGYVRPLNRDVPKGVGGGGGGREMGAWLTIGGCVAPRAEGPLEPLHR